MKNDRRNFLKFTGLASLNIAGGGITKSIASEFAISNSNTLADAAKPGFDEQHLSIIGLYGEWASSLTEKNCRHFRSEEKNGQTWIHGGRSREIG